jgi:hypothetical protein
MLAFNMIPKVLPQAHSQMSQRSIAGREGREGLPGREGDGFAGGVQRERVLLSCLKVEEGESQITDVDVDLAT